MSFHKLYAGASAVIVLVAVVWGFMLVGSPTTERLRKFDDRRIEELRIINNEILNIVHAGRWDWMNDTVPSLQEPLPKDLQQVADHATGQKVNIADPQTGVLYEYVVTGKNTYDLCALFNAERNESYDVFWNHPAGRVCYSFDALKAEGYNPKLMEAVPAKPL